MLAGPWLHLNMETGCKTLRDFLRWLERQYDLLDAIYQHGPPHHRRGAPEALLADGLPTETDDTFFVEMEAAQIVEEARRLACRFGGGHLAGEEVGTVTLREALGIVGKLLDWARNTVPNANTLTVTEAARLLRVSRNNNPGVDRFRPTEGREHGQGGRGGPGIRSHARTWRASSTAGPGNPTPSRPSGGGPALTV